MMSGGKNNPLSVESSCNLLALFILPNIMAAKKVLCVSWIEDTIKVYCFIMNLP